MLNNVTLLYVLPSSVTGSPHDQLPLLAKGTVTSSTGWHGWWAKIANVTVPQLRCMYVWAMLPCL